VFGISSILGPLLGAYITDHIAWQWIFYLNLPIGIASLAIVSFYYKESPEHSKQRIDWLGASSLVGAIVSLMFALELGGKSYAWDSLPILGLFAGFALLTIIFLVAEKRAAEPIISFRMFKNRLFASSNALGMFSGAAFIIASVYIPIFIQGVLGGTATNSGLVLLPMMLGIVVSATVGGSIMSKFSYRAIMIPPVFVLLAGCALLTTLNEDSSRFLITVYMVMVGLGVGASFSVLSNAAVHSFPMNQQGAANATLTFLRSFGMTLGITVIGIVQNHALTRKLEGAFARGGEQGAMPQDLNLSDPHSLMDPLTRARIPTQALHTITHGLSSSIVTAFAWSLIPAALAVIAAFLMSKERISSLAADVVDVDKPEATMISAKSITVQ
jgi:MFS family permease